MKITFASILLVIQIFSFAQARLKVREYRDCYRDCKKTYDKWYDNQTQDQKDLAYHQYEEFIECREDEPKCGFNGDSDYSIDNKFNYDSHIYATDIKYAQKCFKECKSELKIEQIYDREDCRIECMKYDDLDDDYKKAMYISVIASIVILIAFIVYCICRQREKIQQQKQQHYAKNVLQTNMETNQNTQTQQQNQSQVSMAEPISIIQEPSYDQQKGILKQQQGQYGQKKDIEFQKN